MKNKRFLKILKDYSRTFAWMIVLLFGYALIISSFQDVTFAQTLSNIWFLPIFMIVILFIYEQILGRFFFRKTRANPTQNFIQHISLKAKEELYLDKKEFQELNKNEAFQKALSAMYQLFLSKEKNQKKYEVYLKPFQEDSTEKAILDLVICEAMILLDQKESD